MTITAVAGTEHWTNKGDVRLFLWEKPAVAGILHASFQQKNDHLVDHILLSCFTQPDPHYLG